MEQSSSVLEKIYYDPSAVGSFGGIDRLLKEAKKIIPNLKKDDVISWLQTQPTYSMFAPALKKFPRLKTLVNGIDEQWQIDLLDMSWFAKENSGVKFLLVAIDIFSRYTWAVPLMNKSQGSVTLALESILKEGRIPQKIQSDQGKEFNNTTFKNLMEKYGIYHFMTSDDTIKCAFVERMNRTIREKIYRFLYHQNTRNYIQALPELIKSYNNTIHSAIKMKPMEVNDENSAQIIMGAREKCAGNPGKLFNVGDFVRISRKKGVFEKGSTSRWTEEVFKISKRKKTPRTFIYKLKDLADEDISSVFYPRELIKVSEPQLYKVERIIRRRKNPLTGKKEVFVKWLGYPDKFNSWIPA